MYKIFAVLPIIAQALFGTLGQHETSSKVVSLNASLQDSQATTNADYPLILPGLNETYFVDISAFEMNGFNDSKHSGHRHRFKIVIFLPFCKKEAKQSCTKTPIKQCKDCSMAAAGFFGFAVVVLGLGVLFGNALVIWIFARNRSSFNGTYGKIKVSLAVSDILAGVLFLGIIFPNYVESLNQTSYEISQKFWRSQGTPGSFGAGFFHIFIYTASFYHLVLLAQQRLYAVAFPMRYRQQSPKTVGMGIALAWFASFLVAIAPLWTHRKVIYMYDCPTFLYTAGSNNYYITILFSFVAIVPYTMMVILTLVTGICLYRKRFASGNRDWKKREIMVYFTLVFMLLGLTITTGPYVIAVFLSWHRYTHLPKFQLAFTMCYYLALTNSIVNVLVYSVMDKKFRKASRELLRKFFHLKEKEKRRFSTSSQKKRRSKKSLRTPLNSTH